MKRKIVAFVGSPRKNGNTEILTEAVLRGASEKGCETKMFNLYEMSIKPCTACDFCQENDKCIIKDDISKIINEIKNADTLVLATPVYWWGPSAQFKAFMDRWYNPELRGLIKGKKIIIVVTMGDGELETSRHTTGMLRDALEHIGTDIVEILVGMNSYNKGDILKDKEILLKAEQLGIKIAIN